MATLEQAIGASTLGSAFCDTSSGDRIAVRSTLEGHKPSSPRVFVATLQHGEGAPETVGRAASLDELVAHLRAVGIAGFDPAAGWTAATDATETLASSWSDQAATRSLPPMTDPADFADRDGGPGAPA